MNTSHQIANVIVPFSDQLEQTLKSIFQEERYSVWYLGDSFEQRMTTQNSAPKNATFQFLGSRLDDAADTLEGSLLNLDAQVFRNNKDHLAWICSLVANGGPYPQNLQASAAMFKVIFDIVQDGGRHIFVVNDNALGAAIAETGNLNGLTLTWLGPVTSCCGGGNGLRARASVIKTWVFYTIALKFVRRIHPVNWAGLRDCDVLIVDWVNAKSLSPDGHTGNTWNLARMASLLRDAGLRVGFVANPLIWLDSPQGIVQNVAASYDPAILCTEHKTLFGTLRGCWETWRMSRNLNPSFVVGEQDFSPLLRQLFSLDLNSASVTMAHGYYGIAEYLAKHGVKPKSIVYTFENQGWERAMIKGFRKHLPETRIVGYQHAPYAKRYLSFYLSDMDLSCDNSPDEIIFMGQAYKELFSAHGFPESKSCMGGSLRFENVLSNSRSKICTNQKKTILCSTPSDYPDTYDLILKSIMATKDMPDVRLIVNFHPSIQGPFKSWLVRDLEKVLGKSVVHIEFSFKSALDLLPHADVMLYNSSGTIFEAVLSMVPAICVVADGKVSLNKAPGAELFTVFDPEDLHNALKAILFGDDPLQIAADISSFIAPVDTDTIIYAVSPEKGLQQVQAKHYDTSH